MNYSKLRTNFTNPGAAYRSMPFWAWNDSLCGDELVRQIKSMKEQGIGGFFMHSREGLETEYLSEEWFRLVRVSVDAAKETGMEAWLYDEDRWPSGTAGGRVTREGGDDSRCKGLTMEVSGEFPRNEELLAAYRAVVDGHAIHSFERLEGEKPLRDGEVYLLCRIEVSGASEWFNDESPPDNLNAQSVRRFIDITYEAYKQHVGHEFGKTVKGVFTDEPSLHDTHTSFNPGRGWIPWTYIFADYFGRRRGYDVLDRVPLIFFDGEGDAPIRHDYWRTVTELYVESYSRQIGEWCGANNISFTGHFLQENRIGLSTRVGGAVMPHFVYQHVPGIDLLMEQTNEYLTVRQCTSVANQYSRPWVLTETYGCTGWHFTFEGQKWLGDWQFVQGVTRRSQHLALYSIRGCRKRDYPPVFNYNTSWWKHNHVVDNYFARLSAVLSEGQSVRDILVLHPATTAWAMLGTSPYGTPRRRDERDIPAIDLEGYKVNNLLKYLMGKHYDFDLGDELIMSEETSVYDGVFTVKDRSYKTVIIPAVKSMLRSTYMLLISFLERGGRVVALKPFATMIEGRESSDCLKVLFEHKNVFACESFRDITDTLDGFECRAVSIQDEHGNENADLFCLLKEMGGAAIGMKALFVFNHSRERNYSVKIKLAAPVTGDTEEWDLLSDKVICPEISEGGISAEFGPAESKLYVISESNTQSPLRLPRDGELRLHTTLPHVFAIKCDLPNALTLDVCAYRISGAPFSDEMQVWQAQREIRDSLGMRQIYYNGLPQRYKWVNEPHPGDGAEVDLLFRFYVEHVPQSGICLAVESPEHFEIKLNSVKAAESEENNYFIDKSIGVVRLHGVRQGVNELVISCAYKNSYELEDCYLIGDFGVSTDRRIINKPQSLGLGDWCLQGLTHYAGSVVYQCAAELTTEPGTRYFLNIGKFSATTVSVRINNKTAGHIPWKCANNLEITDFLTDGRNHFELEVVGSPRNLFGPFHLKNGEPMVTSWQSFRAEGDDYIPEYNLQPYGLFECIQILNIEKRH